MAWRLAHPAPALPVAMPAWQQRAATAIKRSEFGVKRGAVGIGDDVKISIQIEAYKN